MAHNCIAMACPMAGILSRATTGGDDFMCSFHFFGQPNDWPSITEKLSHESKLINRIYKLTKTATTQLDETGKPAFQYLSEARTELKRRVSNG